MKISCYVAFKMLQMDIKISCYVAFKIAYRWILRYPVLFGQLRHKKQSYHTQTCSCVKVLFFILCFKMTYRWILKYPVLFGQLRHKKQSDHTQPCSCVNLLFSSYRQIMSTLLLFIILEATYCLILCSDSPPMRIWKNDIHYSIHSECYLPCE